MTAPDTPDQLATVAQLQQWMNVTFDADDEVRAASILRIISGAARVVAGKIWPDPLAADFPITVSGIVLAASRREMESPRRVTHEVKGPESASYLESAQSASFFNEAECKFLKRFRPGGGMFTVRTMKDEEEWTLGYIHVLGSSRPIPYFNQGDPGWFQSEKY
jgi:hypothetical protein